MSHTKKISSALFCLLQTTVFMFSLTQTASANSWPSASSLSLIKSSCPAGSSQYPELARLSDEIAAVATVDQAREMALAPTNEAIGALHNARVMMPFSDDLSAAETRLADARARILMASSQQQVADEFSGMMLAGLDNDSVAHVSVGKVGCDYSTGEVIAIVIGLILGIIPGLILLIVLC